jgi:hypothetical protein
MKKRNTQVGFDPDHPFWTTPPDHPFWTTPPSPPSRKSSGSMHNIDPINVTRTPRTTFPDPQSTRAGPLRDDHDRYEALLRFYGRASATAAHLLRDDPPSSHPSTPRASAPGSRASASAPGSRASTPRASAPGSGASSHPSTPKASSHGSRASSPGSGALSHPSTPKASSHGSRASAPGSGASSHPSTPKASSHGSRASTPIPPPPSLPRIRVTEGPTLGKRKAERISKNPFNPPPVQPNKKKARTTKPTTVRERAAAFERAVNAFPPN